MPAIVAAAGEDATRHFLNFFTASIRNRHTRRTYARQAQTFLAWCEARGCRELRAVTTPHVSTYIEQLTRSELETASVKQALSNHPCSLAGSWCTRSCPRTRRPLCAGRGIP